MMKLQNPLLLFAIVTAVLPATTPQVKAADGTDQCPRFQFNPPDAYKGGMKYSFVTPDTANPKTSAFASVCTGFWRQPNPQQPSSTAKQNWSITVSKKDDPKVADSYNAKDGYAADRFWECGTLPLCSIPEDFRSLRKRRRIFCADN
jgi:hypothetical protein